SWILIGRVMIGCPTEIPANRSKSVGAPADWVTAVTVPTGVFLISAGSATSAPPCGETTEELPFWSRTTPAWRLVLPVDAGRLPIVMLPWVEFEARHNAVKLTPSVLSMAGSSTGQRLWGAHALGPTWNSWDAPVVAPAELVATAR